MKLRLCHRNSLLSSNKSGFVIRTRLDTQLIRVRTPGVPGVTSNSLFADFQRLLREDYLGEAYCRHEA